MTIYSGWFKTDKGEILIAFDSGSGKRDFQNNFIRAAALAEVKTGVRIAVNDEGRRRIKKTKASMESEE